jgi:hypothetical protein
LNDRHIIDIDKGLSTRVDSDARGLVFEPDRTVAVGGSAPFILPLEVLCPFHFFSITYCI